jgi:curved DNA-binding protein CbpA
MKYFDKCNTIDDAKKLYRELLKQFHPDIAGEAGQENTVKIINEFEKFIDCFMSNSFSEYYADKDETPDMSVITPFQEVLKKIIHLDCDIEIIGYWIYCFNSFSVKYQLKELGFWFSSKHKAWVFSGHNKSRYVTKATLDQLRETKGNWKFERNKSKELEEAV